MGAMSRHDVSSCGRNEVVAVMLVIAEHLEFHSEVDAANGDALRNRQHRR